MKKKYMAIFMALVFFTNMTVHADNSDKDTMSVSTLDEEFEIKEQEIIYGSEEQLKKVNKDTMKFIKTIALDAHTSSRDHGLYPSVTIAQAVLESGSGKSSLSKAPYHNLFGVKGAYKGKSVTVKTHEDDGKGNLYPIYANFKHYPSFEDSIRDHDELLRNGLNGFYSGAWRINARTPAQAAKFLEGRYATDTKYGSKLISLINDYNLERFDNYLTDADLSWLASDSLDPWEIPALEITVPEKQTTWASGYIEKPRSITRKDSSANLLNYVEGEVDLVYVKQTLGLSDNFFGKSLIRFKRNPEVGSIAVYKVENKNNEIIERYGVVEEIREDSIILSEGVNVDGKVKSVYREVSKSSLARFEFINVEKGDENNG